MSLDALHRELAFIGDAHHDLAIDAGVGLHFRHYAVFSGLRYSRNVIAVIATAARAQHPAHGSQRENNGQDGAARDEAAWVQVLEG